MALENKMSSSSPLKSKSKQVRDVDYDIILDTEIDRLLDEKAAKSNLSVFNVKSLIRHLITNESVQKVLEYKMRQSGNEKCNTLNDPSVTTNSINTADPIFSFEPKLTRAKTKALIENNDQFLPLWPISPAKLLQVKQTPTETQILITQDLPEESEAEDDEYIPKEAEILQAWSDDDASVTSISDIGSPTPSMISARNRRRREACVPSSRCSDGDPVFKTPSPKKPNHNRSGLRANAIGLRTRSKLPLNDTPLEVLEQQLIPPDITTDMYAWNEYDNKEYLDFLKTFAFSSITDGGNDDEEADPEYNVMEDEEDDQDKEEHRVDRAVKVSKKELNELIAELFDEYQISSDEGTSSDIFSSKQNVAEPKSSTKVTPPTLVKIPSELKPIESPPDPVHVEDTVTSKNTVIESTIPESPSQLVVLVESQSSSTTCVEVNCNQAKDSKSEPESLFTEATRSILCHQMQKHIQLLATTYVISSGNEDPQTVKVTQAAKSLLLEISRHAELFGHTSVYAAKNIEAAKDIVRTWPSRVIPVNNSSPIKKKILEELRCRPNPPDYELRTVKLICESPAFMYPSLLPHYLSVCHTTTPSQVFTYSEDSLVARGIDELKEKFCILEDNLTFRSIASKLSETLLPVRSPLQIYNRIKNVRKLATSRLINNSLKDYFQKGMVPVAPVDLYIPEEALPPIHQPTEYLTPRWRKSCDNILTGRFPDTMYPVNKITPKQTNGTKRKRASRIDDATEETPNVSSITHSTTTPTLSLSNSTPTISIEQPSSGHSVFSVTNANGEVQFYYSVPAIGTIQPEEVAEINEAATTTNDLVEVEVENSTFEKIPSHPSSGVMASASIAHNSRSGSGGGGNKRKKYNTTPVEQLLETCEQEDDDVLEAFSEAFLFSVTQRLERKNPSLYASFLQLFQDCATTDIAEEELYSKAEELLKDYPDLIKEFRGLQAAEVAFTTGSFVQYRESHAQIHFLQLLEKWTVNCPQLKTKIIQKMKSLQDLTDLTEMKVVDVMQPLFSQIQNPLILDSFKALFPAIFRPQTIVSDNEFEEVDMDGDDKHETHGHLTIEPELDTFETVKLPEEKQVIATNSCPCSCHGDPANVQYHTRARHCNKCCLRFQDGKLFLHSGRVMKPVSIEFTSPELARQVFAPPSYVAVKTTRPSSCSPSANTGAGFLKKVGP